MNREEAIKQIKENKKNSASLCWQFNTCDPNDSDKNIDILNKLLGSVGENPDFRTPIHFDIGKNTHIGDNVFINTNFSVLDMVEVKIGSNVMIGSNVNLSTVIHSLDPEERAKKIGSAKPIIIEDGVWISSNVVVCAGVTIGKNSVIGAGSVVTHDIPSGVLAYGSPTKVIRTLSDSDKIK